MARFFFMAASPGGGSCGLPLGAEGGLVRLFANKRWTFQRFFVTLLRRHPKDDHPFSKNKTNSKTNELMKRLITMLAATILVASTAMDADEALAYAHSKSARPAPASKWNLAMPRSICV